MLFDLVLFDLDGTVLDTLQDLGDAVSFLYSGGMEPLLKALAAGKVTDLSVSEPDLEELFMHFYEGGAEQ